MYFVNTEPTGERKVLHYQAYFYSNLSRDNVSIRLAFFYA